MSQVFTAKRMHPSACPCCGGRGLRSHCLICTQFGWLSICPDCGGTGRIPASIAAIADPAARGVACRRYVAAAPLN